MEKYNVGSQIGVGSFGEVYKAVRKEDSQVVAVKIISKRGRNPKELKNLRRECDIQAKLKHQNVIKMLESFENDNYLVIVTEFASTDLHRYLAKNRALSEEQARSLVCHLVSALYYLHSNRILHRDLKPQNVLLDENLHAKLCDFGLARNMTTGTHVLTSIKGTPLYMAPELLAERPYDYQADLWSLGCISYESMAGEPPFCTTSILQLVKLIKHQSVKWPSDLSSDCRSFLQGLLEKEPNMRFTWAEILCHPFVEGKLFIENVKADDSPFTNPAKSNKTRTGKNYSTRHDEVSTHDVTIKLSALSLNHANKDNLMSSRDSINAIPPSDIENLETDVEDNINSIIVPFAAECSYESQTTSKTHQFVGASATGHSKICAVNDKNNLIVNNLYLPTNATPLNLNKNDKVAQAYAPVTSAAVVQSQHCNQLRKSRNKDLEKRKLSQNLDNFSLRLTQTGDNEKELKMEKDRGTEKERDTSETQKSHQSTGLKNSAHSTDEKQSNNDNSPPCLLPGWDSCDESQSPPIENDEWLAFLKRSMQEVLDGELDSLKQQNMVSIIVAPLRNTKAIPCVIECVAQLLSLPFALNESCSTIDLIKTVYVNVKLVPNLMYASKLLAYQKNINDSSASVTLSASLHATRSIRPISDLSSEEIRTLSRLYELVCHLVHLRQQCLIQFCDAVTVLAAHDLLLNMLDHDFKNSFAIRTSSCILAIFLCVLRELPENAELVEKIIYNSKLNLLHLLQQKDELFRTRICMLFRLLTRFSLRGLQVIWSTKLKQAFESLAEDQNTEVKESAEKTLEELRLFAFYG